MALTFAGQAFKIVRYPSTQNRSLRAYAAADELLLLYLSTLNLKEGTLLLMHDRFGGLASCLHAYQPKFIAAYRSQEKALTLTLAANQLPEAEIEVSKPLDPLSKDHEVCVMRLPKSLALFELYLAKAVASCGQDGEIVIGFMTRHFSPKVLAIAQRYAGEVRQSKAQKKARLLHLKALKTAPFTAEKYLHSLSFRGAIFQQYFGVFSANRIDIATQFLLDTLLEHDWVDLKEKRVSSMLDLACGNGVIAYYLQSIFPSAKLYLHDDAALAIASAKLNLGWEGNTFLYADDLADLRSSSLELVVSNPPFHFGYENNIEVSIKLFSEVAEVLKADGLFILVANRHLNYLTHLSKLFMAVVTVATNEKFVIYQCTK